MFILLMEECMPEEFNWYKLWGIKRWSEGEKDWNLCITDSEEENLQSAK